MSKGILKEIKLNKNLIWGKICIIRKSKMPRKRCKASQKPNSKSKSKINPSGIFHILASSIFGKKRFLLKRFFFLLVQKNSFWKISFWKNPFLLKRRQKVAKSNLKTYFFDSLKNFWPTFKKSHQWDYSNFSFVRALLWRQDKWHTILQLLQHSRKGTFL